MKKAYEAGYKACMKSKGKDIWDAVGSGKDWNRGYNRCFAENFAKEFVADIHARFPAPNKPQKQRSRYD